LNGKRMMEISKQRQFGWLNAARMRGFWRWSVTLFTALSFCLIVATSESHMHTAAAAAHDCAICSVVLDKLSGAPSMPLLAHAFTLQSYRVDVVSRVETAYSSPRLLPPSCGPPHASV
jgi:hypothetical protein